MREQVVRKRLKFGADIACLVAKESLDGDGSAALPDAMNSEVRGRDVGARWESGRKVDLGPGWLLEGGRDMGNHGDGLGSRGPEGDAGTGAGAPAPEARTGVGEDQVEYLVITAGDPTLPPLATLRGKNPVVVVGITVTDEEREAARRDGHDFSDEDLALAMFHGFY